MGKVREAGPSVRLALFDATGNRTARWQRVIAMRPVDPTETGIAAPDRGAAGFAWEALLADDSTLFARLGAFRTRGQARRDAEAVFAGAAQLRLLYVRDDASGHLAWWIVRGAEVVLVSARTWPPTKRPSVVSGAKRAQAALTSLPPWIDETK